MPKKIAIRDYKYWTGTGSGKELFASLVPCVVKATGEVGFYDYVSKQFLGNVAGSGSFYLA